MLVWGQFHRRADDFLEYDSTPDNSTLEQVYAEKSRQPPTILLNE